MENDDARPASAHSLCSRDIADLVSPDCRRVAQDGGGSAGGKILNGNAGVSKPTRRACAGTSSQATCPRRMQHIDAQSRRTRKKTRPTRNSRRRPASRSSNFAEAARQAARRCAPRRTATSSSPKATRGRIRVLRRAPTARRPRQARFSPSGLDRPFGIAFYPPGGDPQWVYVANTDSVVRFPYRSGDLKARGAAEIVVAKLPTVAAALDARHRLLARTARRCSSRSAPASNVGEGMREATRAALQTMESEASARRGLGQRERPRRRARPSIPRARTSRIFATGIRNCVGIAIHPANGDLWCVDQRARPLGDDLPPDYVTRVQRRRVLRLALVLHRRPRGPAAQGRAARPQGQDHRARRADPGALGRARHDLLRRRPVPGRLSRATSSSPCTARGTGSKRTGYKVVRVIVKDGVPTGEYEDFLTGFGIDDAHVWGRPVGVDRRQGRLAAVLRGRQRPHLPRLAHGTGLVTVTAQTTTRAPDMAPQAERLARL